MGITREFTVEQRGLSLPDYAALKPVGTVPIGPVYTSTDIAELAARLGSIVTFDRRGNVLWFEDFENTLGAWTTHYSGIGGSVALSTTRARSGSFSAKLVTGNVTGNEVWISRSFPLPSSDRLGFEVSFTIVEQMATIKFQIKIDAINGNAYWLAIQYTYATKKLEYQGIDWEWHTIQEILMGSSYSWFHTMKLVFDQHSGKYTRLIWDNAEFDLSTISYSCDVGGGALPKVTVWIEGVTASDLNVPMYIDDVIVTQNEPPNPK